MLRLGARLAGPRCLLLCLLPAVLGAQPGWAGRPKPLPCQQVRLFPRAVASPALPTGAELGPSTHPAAQRRQVPNANPSARPQPASVSFCLPSLPTFVLPSALLPSSLFARGPSQPLPVLLCWWHLEQCPRSAEAMPWVPSEGITSEGGDGDALALSVLPLPFRPWCCLGGQPDPEASPCSVSSRQSFSFPSAQCLSPRAGARGVGDDPQKPSDACQQPEGCGPPKRCHRWHQPAPGQEQVSQATGSVPPRHRALQTRKPHHP